MTRPNLEWILQNFYPICFSNKLSQNTVVHYSDISCAHTFATWAGLGRESSSLMSGCNDNFGFHIFFQSLFSTMR